MKFQNNNLANLGKGDIKRIIAISELVVKGAYKQDNLANIKLIYFENMSGWVVETPTFTYFIERFDYLYNYNFCYKVTKHHNTDKYYKPLLRIVDPVTFKRIPALGFEELLNGLI